MRALPVGVSFSDDPSCQRVTGNPAVLAQFEVTAVDNLSASAPNDRAPGRQVRFFRDGQLLTAADLPLQRAVAENREIPPEELEVQLPSGRRWFAHASGAPIRDQQGKVIGGVAVTEDITERKHAVAAISEQRAELQLILDSTPALIFYKDTKNHFLRVNRTFAESMGASKERLEGRSLFELYPRAQAEAFWKDDQEVLSSGRPKLKIVEPMQTPSGERWVQTDKVPCHDAQGNLSGLIGFSVDITERKQREELLERLNRTLKALKDSSQAMIRATSEGEYLREVCRIVVADCGHTMVWVGLAEEDEAKTVYPAAAAGFEEGYLETVNITWTDNEHGRGPTGTAIRTGRPCPCKNIRLDPLFAPWREEACKRGYASSLAVPLLAGSRAFGAITIYSRQPDAFSADEVMLLTQLADDVSYCIRTLRLRAAKAEADLERDKFVSLADNSAEFIGMCDMNLVPFYVNAAGRRLVGLDCLAQACRTPVGEFFFPEDRKQILEEFFPRVLRDGRAEVEVRFRHFKTGAAIWMIYNVFYIKDAQGRPVGLATVSRNISERRQAERRASLLAETASQLLATDSPQRVVEDLCHKVLAFLDCQVFFNFLVDEQPIGRNLTGATSSAGSGAGAKSIITGKVAPAALGEGRTAAVTAGRLRLNAYAGIPAQEAQRIEWLEYGSDICGCTARDGCRIVAEDIQHTADPRTELVKSYGIQAYACHPLLAGGRILGTLSFGTGTRASFAPEELALMKAVADQVASAIERQRVQAALQQTAEELKRSNRDLEQFAYVASHDLQEPLRAVGGYVKLLERRLSGNLDDKARGFIAGALDGALRMERLVNDLLTFSRVGTRGAELVPTELEGVLQHALDNLRGAIDAVQATVSHDPLPTVTADATQLMQVFQNLIGNAIKFRGEQLPRIHVGAHQQNGRWVCWVRDNGIGIDPCYFGRIFQVFQRLHTRNKYPGTGIGLAICKKIVERHGGEIWVESQPGGGSTFYFSLPQFPG